MGENIYGELSKVK